MRKKVLWSHAVQSCVEGEGTNFMARAAITSLAVDTLSVFLECAMKDQPDLIVLDAASVDLPVLTICHTIRSDERTRKIPILAFGSPDVNDDSLLRTGVTDVISRDTEPDLLHHRIAGSLRMKLRRYPRYPIVLPVARGRIFHEFLGYSSALSEGGMGFDTVSHVRGGGSLPLRIYRNADERPINVLGGIRGVRPNNDTGVGYAVGVEFLRLGAADHSRLCELLAAEPCVTWSGDHPADSRPPLV